MAAAAAMTVKKVINNKTSCAAAVVTRSNVRAAVTRDVTASDRATTGSGRPRLDGSTAKFRSPFLSEFIYEIHARQSPLA